MLDQPYVTVDEFRHHPHYLDLDNLLVGKPQAYQDSVIADALLFASTWADEEVQMPLRAHAHLENVTMRADRRGRLKLHPEHAPVISVTGLAVGVDPSSVQSLGDVQAWPELGGRMITAYGPSSPALGALQFGTPPPGEEMLTTWTYVAGYPATQLAADVTAGATAVTVTDTTGILPGTVLRLWTPAAEEAITVTTVAGSTLNLSKALSGAHSAGMSCTALPPDARMAVIKMAVVKLLRKGPLAEAAGRFPKGPSPHASAGDPKRTTASGNYQAAACGLLSSYKRVR